VLPHGEETGNAVKPTGYSSMATGPKSKCRKWAEAVLSRSLTDGQSIEIEDLVNLPCRVVIAHKVGDNNELYGVIDNVPPASSSTPKHQNPKSQALPIEICGSKRRRRTVLIQSRGGEGSLPHLPYQGGVPMNQGQFTKGNPSLELLSLLRAAAVKRAAVPPSPTSSASTPPTPEPCAVTINGHFNALTETMYALESVLLKQLTTVYNGRLPSQKKRAPVRTILRHMAEIARDFAAFMPEDR
jgi:hypothetical protein